MLEVDPESRAQAFKGSSSVNHAPPMAEDKASTQGPGALAGLKVIDLTRVLGGPYCTMVLSDHGAEVIKLEPPQGDETREWGPPFDDAGDADDLEPGHRLHKDQRRMRQLLCRAVLGTVSRRAHASRWTRRALLVANRGSLAISGMSCRSIRWWCFPP
jgi:hypothetical protein